MDKGTTMLLTPLIDDKNYVTDRIIFLEFLQKIKRWVTV